MNEREIFEAALELADPAERVGYLDRVCEGNAPLRDHLRGLLEAHDKLGGFLQRPLPIAGDVTSAQSPSPKVGAIIAGRYKLLEQIGEGGMGSVWVAEQSEPVRRRVALKLIKPGMDTRQVLSRFEAERQALALMDHPNIAKVFDGGMTDEGRPFFVMEYVKGLPITQYCDDTRLTVADRLALFTQVCQAVQHAHQKGIIHRDLKPSNILVCLYDGQPVPKVIDFGLAKAMHQSLTEHTLYTAHGLMVGTPLYMSPEQAEFNNLDIDTRSDIYSLGVILYELLTGTTPLEKRHFKDAAWQEMLRLIKEEEPPRPSVRLSGSGSLPSIAAQRNLDPAKLTKTVRGELDWIVMKALDKDRSRRYETANGLAADVQRYLSDEPVQACPPSAGYRLRKFARRNKRALATATLAGVVLLVALGTVAGNIGWLMRDQEARRTKLAGQLELILAEVKKQEVEQKWPEALSAARRAEALVAGGGGDAALEKQVRDVLADLTLVERLEDLWLELAGRNEDNTYQWSDQAYAAAFREYGIDLDHCTAQQAAERLGSRPVAVTVGAWLDHWATCRRALGDDTGSVKLLMLAGQIDPDPWRHKVRDAMARKDLKALDEMADAADLASQQAPTLYLLGTMLHRSGKQDRAMEVFRQAQRSHPDDYWINATLGRNLSVQGPAHALESVGFLRVAMALRPHKANIHHALGFSLYQAGKLDEAIACFRKAIELDPKYARAHDSLGYALQKQNKPDEAIACYRTAIKLDPKFAGAHNNLGLALAGQKKPEEAIACYHAAIKFDPKYAGAHNNLGNVLKDQGRLDEAIASYRKAIELEPRWADARSHLGLALAAQNKLDEAITCYRKAIELEPKFAGAHNNLGCALAAQKKLDEAITCYRKAIELEPKYVYAHNNLGLALAYRKQLDEAIACYRKAIELDPKVVQAHIYLGTALTAQNNHDEAIVCYRRAIEVNPKYATAHNNLAWLRATCSDPRLREPAEALAAAKTAVELDPNNPVFPSTLGAAYYRSGDWKAATTAFEKSMELRGGGDSIEWFFLAMTHWQLGDKEKAQAWHDRAIEWMEKNQPGNEELRRFRSEAEVLLGIAESAGRKSP